MRSQHCYNNKLLDRLNMYVNSTICSIALLYKFSRYYGN